MEKYDEFTLVQKRWLAREIHAGRISIRQATCQFNFDSKDAYGLVKSRSLKYKPEIELILPAMTEKEKQKAEELQKRIKELEKRLEHAQMKNIALETLIDIAEEKLKIDIRKKPGPKQ
jgi:uncharacterized protein YlxW (UPF0749 family)